MNNRLQVLIVGPYQYVHNSVRFENADIARDLAMKVMMKGHLPLYGNWEQDFTMQIDHNHVFEQTLAAVETCDAVLIFGQSRDVTALVERAKMLGRQVFYTIDEIPG